MITIFCIYPGDEELALKNARWVKSLGGCPGHKLVFGYDRRCVLTKDIIAELNKSFDDVQAIILPADVDGWPHGANYFFRTMVGHMQYRDDVRYFFWWEPDAIPLKEGWLTALEQEFIKVAIPMGKRFMGDRVQVENIPLHMSGIAIYPNPLHAFAGEAYRAYDVAFDMAGKDQIVGLAHWTKLIEHAWKHPKFTSIDELRTQIRPEAVIFHSSKDGSLIDLLEQKRGGKQKADVATTKEPQGSPFPQPSKLAVTEKQLLTTDIFIRTYPGDYKWLQHCLESIATYARGFRKLWIVSPEPAPVKFGPGTLPGAVTACEWLVKNEEADDHYLSQQIHKLYADVLTSYQADYIMHIDSDTLLTMQVTPETFFSSEGRLNWPFTPYKDIETPWQPITEKFLRESVENEFMRRFPIVIPMWLYSKVREFCFSTHKMIISQYVKLQPERAFSEFNALGAFAWRFYRDAFNFIDTNQILPAPVARQFHSWSGITPEVQKEIDGILRTPCDTPQRLSGQSGGTSAESPPGGVHPLNAVPVLAFATEPLQSNTGEARESTIKNEQRSTGRGINNRPDSRGGVQPMAAPKTEPTATTVSRSGPTPSLEEIEDRGAQSTPPGVKELSSGIWVIEGDTHISKWVEESGKLNHDLNSLPFILPMIQPGDTVIDAGASIGDHTIAYSQAVGHLGLVLAFEPHPVAFECLKHNLKSHDNTVVYQKALGDREYETSITTEDNNYGGAYLTDYGNGKVEVVTLDSLNIRPDLIKLDVEGFESRVLAGAQETIHKHRPKMVIEINHGALHRQATSWEDIMNFLVAFGYTYQIMQTNCTYKSPMFDLIAWPKDVRGAVEKDRERPTAPAPNFVDHVKALADYIESHGKAKGYAKMRVLNQLKRFNITTSRHDKKKPNARNPGVSGS